MSTVTGKYQVPMAINETWHNRSTVGIDPSDVIGMWSLTTRTNPGDHTVDHQDSRVGNETIR
jgi:hypothetical protein